MPLQMAYDLDKSDEGIRGQLFAAYLDVESRRRRASVAKGVDELKQIAAVLEKAGDSRRGARRARRGGRERSVGPRSPRRSGAGLCGARRSRQGAHLSVRGNGRHQSRAVADAGGDGAARATASPKARRRSCRRCRSIATRRRRPSCSAASWPKRIPKPATSRSMRSPTPRSRKATSPPPPSRSTSSPRACARTWSR